MKFFIYNFFIFSSSLLKFCVHLFFSPNLVSIHLLTFWILYLVKYLYFIIFSVLFSCSFNWEQFLCLLILLNYSVSMNLALTITSDGLEIVSLCGSVHYRLLMPSTFVWRARFDMDKSHVLPQDMLAAITLVGGEFGGGESKTGARCEAELCRSGLSWLCSFCVCVFLSPNSWTAASEEAVLKQGGVYVGSWLMMGH